MVRPCDLVRKYETILALRDARAAGGGVASRAALRAFAGEFPGALRELDRLPRALIEERLDTLDAVVRCAVAAAPWVDWMCAWHEHLRAALAEKSALQSARPGAARLTDRTLDALARRFNVERAVIRAALLPYPDRRTDRGMNPNSSHSQGEIQ
jgi:hypothetical protein